MNASQDIKQEFFSVSQDLVFSQSFLAQGCRLTRQSATLVLSKLISDDRWDDVAPFHQPLPVQLTFFLLCLCVCQGFIKKTVHAFIFSAWKTFFLGPSFEHRHVINSGKRQKINKEINKSAVWEQSMDFWKHDISIFFSPSPLSYSLAWPYLFISEGSGLNETREPLKL